MSKVLLRLNFLNAVRIESFSSSIRDQQHAIALNYTSSFAAPMCKHSYERNEKIGSVNTQTKRIHNIKQAYSNNPRENEFLAGACVQIHSFVWLVSLLELLCGWHGIHFFLSFAFSFWFSPKQITSGPLFPLHFCKIYYHTHKLKVLRYYVSLDEKKRSGANNFLDDSLAD